MTFALAILGSWVRINEAGMTCPDWPLCKGSLVPELAGGVVLEWTHRLVALVVGFALLGAFITGWSVRKQIAGVVPCLITIAVVFVTQISVGGFTIFQANSPPSVALHWGTAMALLAALATLALLALTQPVPGSGLPAVRAGSPFAPLVLAALAAFVTMCVGSYVSSSHAGLACPSFPGCDGTLLGATSAQTAQMLHRLAAAALLAAGVFAYAAAVQSGMARVRTAAAAGIVLLLLQISLGIANVLLSMPMVLREAHAANAVLTYLAFVAAAALATIDPLPARSARTLDGLSLAGASRSGEPI